MNNNLRCRGKLSSADHAQITHTTFFECLYGALSAAAGPSLAYPRDKQQGRIWRRITQEVHKIKIGRGPLLPCIISQSHADRGHSIYKIPAPRRFKLNSLGGVMASQ